MEKKTTSKKKATTAKEAFNFITAYKQYLLEHGHKPSSVFKFCKDNGQTEEAFYAQFASFNTLEKNIFLSYFQQVKLTLEADSNYLEFTAREKLLAFYYSLIEVLRKDRSLVLILAGSHQILKPEFVPDYLKLFKSSFEDWIKEIIAEGKITGEVANRPIGFDKPYASIFWLHFNWLLQFWLKDESKGFESTDAAIEKSINLAFEFIGQNALDRVLDFAKFLYQTHR
ncbi:MAG TPA: TetR family transcriptional regulator C-terminal domain-containing protein [Cyclobacteriaceae bacterium]|nr:TetR family transcriptional regulator C-terminal domain-containing protein [Cyclobacteriaceae bacterium]